MSRFRPRQAIVLTAIAFIAGAGSLALGGSPAGSAETHHVERTEGVGLTVRSEPSVDAPAVGHLAEGEAVTIECQTEGGDVLGSSIWNRVPGGWASDYFFDTPVYDGYSPGLAECAAGPAPAEPAPPSPTTHCGTFWVDSVTWISRPGGHWKVSISPSWYSRRAIFLGNPVGASNGIWGDLRNACLPGAGSTSVLDAHQASLFAQLDCHVVIAPFTPDRAGPTWDLETDSPNTNLVDVARNGCN